MLQKLKLVLTLLSSADGTGKRSRGTVLQWLEKVSTVGSANPGYEALRTDLNDELKVGHLGVNSNYDERFIDAQARELVANGISVTTFFDKEYPSMLSNSLGHRAPIFLFWKGNVDLFERISVGFCGSRHATAKGLDVCRDIVEQLVAQKIAIVAGYAAGVDQTAHYTALKCGGETVAVLAEGILNFSIRQSLAPEWDWRRSLVVSEYLPQARWAVPKAMQRNRTIIGLGRALVVIEARESGGTFEAGQSALALKKPLFAPTYEEIEATAPGNQILISRGATPIMKSKSMGRANIKALLGLTLPPGSIPAVGS